MLKTLVKKQIAEIFRSYVYDAKKNKARSKGATAGYIVLFVFLMIGVLGGMFSFLAYFMCGSMAAAGMDWLYFALMGLLAVFLGTFGSVFNTYSGLYLAKDNDLLLSMPIPVNTVMTARLLGVYLMGLMYSLTVLLPSVIVYWIVVSAGVGAVIGGIMLIADVSIFVLTLSVVLGYVVAKISLKLKNKSFITVIVSLVFIGAYYFFYFKAQGMVTDIVSNAAKYGARIKGSAYPVYMFGKLGTGDPMAVLCVTAVIAAVFAVVWAIIAHSFLKIATSSGKTVKRKYKDMPLKTKSVQSAVFSRELRRFTASPNYMLNCGLGILLIPVFGVVMLFVGKDMVAVLGALFGGETDSIQVVFCVILCLLAAMNDMAAPSVSLEGKSLWISQSLPITPWQVIRAKLSVQLVLTAVPMLFGIICAAVVCRCSPIQLLFLTAVPLLYVLIKANFDMFMGLKMPNLVWTSEITPIKQSGAVAISLLAGFVYAILPAVLFFAVGYKIGFAAFMGIFSAATLILSLLLFNWLKKKGTKVFACL